MSVTARGSGSGRALVLVMAAVTMLTACINQKPAKPEGSPTPDARLGEAPQPLVVGEGGVTTTSISRQRSSSASPLSTAPGQQGSDGTDGAGAAPSTTSASGSGSTDAKAEAPFHEIARIDDRRGDHGLEGAAHGDLVSVVLEENGSSLRARVTVAGDVPSTLAAGEVEGIGIDLTLGGVAYQLFADGGEDGWLAYLHTPQGFVAFPGAFRLGGPQLEFEVPWPAVGGRRAGTFSVFADWSRRRSPLNAASNDHAPNGDPAPFRP